MSDRPPISVIVPFAGGPAAARRMYDALRALRLRHRDEVLLVDNSQGGILARVPAAPGCLLRADREPSSYHARNVGARASKGEWLLFMDADCAPDPGLLDAYFAPAPGPRCGLVAGDIRASDAGSGFVVEWSRWRAVLGPQHARGHAYRPFGSTANLLVRRAAFEEAGGFCEGIRSGGDADLCWRVLELGWAFEERPDAFVEHRHRESVRALVAQAARYGRGRAWLERRFPDCPPPQGTARALLRAGAAIGYHALRRDRRMVAFRGLDALFLAAMTLARAFTNRPAGAPRVTGAGETALVVEPPTDPGIGAERLEALRRGRPAATPSDVAYAEDDALVERLAALARLVTRRPAGVGRAVRTDPRELWRSAAVVERVLRTGGTVQAAPQRSRVASLIGVLTGQAGSTS